MNIKLVWKNINLLLDIIDVLNVFYDYFIIYKKINF